MSNLRFSYQSEKLSQACSALMLPHDRGEAASIAESFEFLSRAFHELDEGKLDASAKEWVSTLRAFMDTTGVAGETGRWFTKAQTFTFDDKVKITHAVDELASWFEHEFWESAK